MMDRYELIDWIAKEYDNHPWHGSSCNTCVDIFEIIVGWTIHHNEVKLIENRQGVNDHENRTSQKRQTQDHSG